MQTEAAGLEAFGCGEVPRPAPLTQCDWTQRQCYEGQRTWRVGTRISQHGCIGGGGGGGVGSHTRRILRQANPHPPQNVLQRAIGLQHATNLWPRSTNCCCCRRRIAANGTARSRGRGMGTPVTASRRRSCHYAGFLGPRWLVVGIRRVCAAHGFPRLVVDAWWWSWQTTQQRVSTQVQCRCRGVLCNEARHKRPAHCRQPVLGHVYRLHGARANTTKLTNSTRPCG